MKKKNNNKLLLLAIIPVALVLVILYTKANANTNDSVVTTTVGSKVGQIREDVTREIEPLTVNNDPVISGALAYYLEQVGDGVNQEGVEVVKKNFGCHFEIHVFLDGELAMRLSYSGGNYYEI